MRFQKRTVSALLFSAMLPATCQAILFDGMSDWIVGGGVLFAIFSVLIASALLALHSLWRWVPNAKLWTRLKKSKMRTWLVGILWGISIYAALCSEPVNLLSQFEHGGLVRGVFTVVFILLVPLVPLIFGIWSLVLAPIIFGLIFQIYHFNPFRDRLGRFGWLSSTVGLGSLIFAWCEVLGLAEHRKSGAIHFHLQDAIPNLMLILKVATYGTRPSMTEVYPASVGSLALLSVLLVSSYALAAAWQVRNARHHPKTK